MRKNVSEKRKETNGQMEGGRLEIKGRSGRAAGDGGGGGGEKKEKERRTRES